MSRTTPPEGVMRFVIEGPRDTRGRCTFTTEWAGHRMDGEYGLRTQVSFANPDDHVTDARRRGWNVEVVEGGGS